MHVPLSEDLLQFVIYLKSGYLLSVLKPPPLSLSHLKAAGSLFLLVSVSTVCPPCLLEMLPVFHLRLKLSSIISSSASPFVEPPRYPHVNNSSPFSPLPLEALLVSPGVVAAVGPSPFAWVPLGTPGSSVLFFRN